ncbi:hypothetical protein ES703_72849 [subsurface metagenome]
MKLNRQSKLLLRASEFDSLIGGEVDSFHNIELVQGNADSSDRLGVLDALIPGKSDSLG